MGEAPATIGLTVLGLSTAGTGITGGGANLGAGGNFGGEEFGGNQQGVGNQFGGQIAILEILSRVIPPVIDPVTGEVLSTMIYNPMTNQLIVHNTPTNHRKLQEQLAELDVTPKQVSIESKFVTISVSDLDKIGFSWDITQSDLNGRPRTLPSLEFDTYAYDINGDGNTENIPFYNRPDGTNVIDNTVLETVLTALATPGPAGTFNLAATLTDNKDGNSVGVAMDFLDSMVESELLSAPRVTTMSRKPAVIADFQFQTFNTQSITTLQTASAGFGGSAAQSATTNLIFTTFAFGITLSVTPQISGGDQIRLWLNPQVTSMMGFDDFELPGAIIDGQRLEPTTARYPRTSVQSVWTNVIVHDGDTLVLGGLVSDRTSKSIEKLPYLSNLPVLGFLFRGKSSEVSQSSLLIFVTPEIVDTTGARYFGPES